MELDPFLLSRIQFAANITFHIMFPSITIALGWILFFFKTRFSITKDESWMKSYFFFTKVFALSFAIGVVSGITMSFQFGTNWPGFMETVGNIAGPLLAYEVLTAFFLEATFLGVMLFGFRRVPNWLHTLATFLVAIGTTASAFWILVLNSWMQTPVGFEMIDGQAFATDWLAILFNPSMPYRMAHMLTASGLTASFLVIGISAYRYLRGDFSKPVMNALKTGLVIAAILAPLQIFIGHAHGVNTRDYQPEKIAAIEGVWETQKDVPLLLFALPDEEARTNKFAIEIPKAASYIVTGDWGGEIKGLNDFDVHPPVNPLFFGFRIMAGIGMLMLALSWIGSGYILRNKKLPTIITYSLIAMTLSGCFATIAGWYVTEVGRQPWLVYGVLTTKDALGPVSGGMVLSTLIIYLAIYVFISIAYVYTLFYMARNASDPNTPSPDKQIIHGTERLTIIKSQDKKEA